MSESDNSITTRTLSGGCLCGVVRYEVEDAFRYSLICHCSQCRRATGAANKPFAGIERQMLRVVAGADAMIIYGGALTHDARCGRCGSYLYSIVRDGSWAHVALGSLSDEPTIRPAAHIFVGSKASWELINDGLPQHDGLP